MQANILEAQSRLSELIRCAQAGEDVVIANRGRPGVRLVLESSVEPGGSETSGQTMIDWLADHPLPPGSRRSAVEIEAGIEEERGAWDRSASTAAS